MVKRPLVPARRRRRFLALTTIGVATVVFAGTAPAPAAPPAAPDRPAAAAGWLARQMVNGERFEATFSGSVFPDQGLTIDAVFAFAAAGVSGDNAAKAIAWLAKPDILSGYLGDGTTEVYAGAHAKLLRAAQVQGKNPASFGGVDLVTRLRGLQAPSGRFSDKSAFGDFSNAFSQSLAVIALDGTSGGAPAAAVAFLAGSQCPDGGFPLDFGKPTCTSEVDATSLVTQTLLVAGEPETATKALDWLVSKQQPDGGFGGAGPTAGENANSTGVATQALRVGGRKEAADKGVAFLAGLQVGCDGPAANRGAVAYDATGFAAATATRATAQGILGLAGVGLADLDGTGETAAAPTLECVTSPSPTSSGGGAGGGLPVTGAPVAVTPRWPPRA